MAENDNIELDDDLGLDDLDNDSPLETAVSSKDNGWRRLISTLFSNRRYVILGLVVVLAVIIGAWAVMFRNSPSVPATSSSMVQGESPTFDGASIVKKKPKKKKKKKIKYVDLYKQLDGKQLSPILRELSYLNISYNIVQNGKQFDLQIDQTQIDEAKHILASFT